MRKFLLGVILLMGCVGGGDPPPLKTFEVRCPLTTIETATDTVRAASYGYTSGFLYVRSIHRGIYKEYPNTCVVKEIAE